MKTTIGTIARTIAGTTATGRSLAILALLQAMSCAALAADSPKLAAPVYPGAVPAVLAGAIPLTEMLSYPVYRLWLSLVCVILAGLMYYLIQHTRLGMMIRAGASNREMTQSLGIDIGLLYRLVFALGVALAAFAGMIAAPVSSVFPGMGNQVLIISFVVVVIGGIGSVKGAMAAALLIGLIDTFGKVVEFEIAGFRVLPELAGMSVFVMMAIVLLWRPEGLFARRLR